jgi:3-mercaptopyruvate sulfurtransferase SseA
MKFSPLKTATVLANLRHRKQFGEAELLSILRSGHASAAVEVVITDFFDELDKMPGLLDRLIESEGLDREKVMAMKARLQE